MSNEKSAKTASWVHRRPIFKTKKIGLLVKSFFRVKLPPPASIEKFLEIGLFSRAPGYDTRKGRGNRPYFAPGAFPRDLSYFVRIAAKSKINALCGHVSTFPPGTDCKIPSRVYACTHNACKHVRITPGGRKGPDRRKGGTGQRAHACTHASAGGYASGHGTGSPSPREPGRSQSGAIFVVRFCLKIR